MVILRLYFVLFLGALFACPVAVVAAGDAKVPKVPIATASMVSGKVFRQATGEPSQALQRGDGVYQGDLVTTGPGAYVYLSTTDKAFLSIRPGSRLTIVSYQVDPQNPSNNRIRIDLHQGVVRWVSGGGASAARDRFRLNTPVAAIGVRGTDFSVFTDQGVTRASVRSGRIAVSPFNSLCSAAQLGPCAGEATVDLDRATAPVIQVLQGQTRPQLLQSIDLSPDKLAPPALDEPLVPSGAPTGKNGSSSSSASASTTNAVSSSLVPASTVSSRVSELEVAGQVVAVESVIAAQPSADRIAWGRWRDIANLSATQSLNTFIVGRERTHVVGPFMVGRDQGSFSGKPESGLFVFELIDAQAVMLGGSAGSPTVRPASVVNPSLKIDFASNRFFTEIGIRTDDGRVNTLVAQGGVDKHGVLTSESRFSNGIVNGVLAGPNANQAGYVFHRPVLGSTESAVGVTRWAR
jgi:hypothetical protein